MHLLYTKNSYPNSSRLTMKIFLKSWFSGLLQHIVWWLDTNVSEDCAASIFWDEVLGVWKMDTDVGWVWGWVWDKVGYSVIQEEAWKEQVPKRKEKMQHASEGKATFQEGTNRKHRKMPWKWGWKKGCNVLKMELSKWW